MAIGCARHSANAITQVGGVISGVGALGGLAAMMYEFLSNSGDPFSLLAYLLLSVICCGLRLVIVLLGLRNAGRFLTSGRRRRRLNLGVKNVAADGMQLNDFNVMVQSARDAPPPANVRFAELALKRNHTTITKMAGLVAFLSLAGCGCWPLRMTITARVKEGDSCQAYGAEKRDIVVCHFEVVRRRVGYR